jgi:hypothetical protein
MLTARGFFLYFPFLVGKETRPLLQSETSEEGTVVRENSYTVRVYWQDRLVPETVLSQLPFVPKSIQALKNMELNEGISPNWKGRLVGFLFFDWEFHHISNNKLKICVEPDLNTWLNGEAKKHIISQPKKTGDAFIEWLKNCGQKFDREFLFTDRLIDLLDEPGQGPQSIFRKVRIMQARLDFGPGDRLKWKKKIGQNEVIIIGEIVDFVIPEDMHFHEVRILYF